ALRVRNGSAPTFQASEGSKVFQEFVKTFRGLCAVALADRQRLVRLAVPVDNRVGNLLQLGLADPLADRVVSLVDLDAVSGLAQLRRKPAGSLAVVGPDGQDEQLHRREPERELAAVVLDQDADEALERAEQGAM